VRIGAHVPTRGGLPSAIRAAHECGADAIQVFISNPRAWAPPRISAKEADAFGEAWAQSGLGPMFVHAGSGGPGEPAEAFHRAVSALRAVPPQGDCDVVVELTAGTAGSVAATFPEAARLFDAVDDHRLKLCADTCHLFAAGYALDEPEGVAACFEELRTSGLDDRLVLIHANDAKYGRGSRRDRHEHIGQGGIGVEGFFEILHRPEVQDLALVVETPGRLEDHARDIATLRRLATD